MPLVTFVVAWSAIWPDSSSRVRGSPGVRLSGLSRQPFNENPSANPGKKKSADFKNPSNAGSESGDHEKSSFGGAPTPHESVRALFFSGVDGQHRKLCLIASSSSSSSFCSSCSSCSSLGRAIVDKNGLLLGKEFPTIWAHKGGHK